MFSTVDHLQTRRLRLWQTDGTQFELPEDLELHAATVRAYPSSERLQEFADRLAERSDGPVYVELVRLTFDASHNAFTVRRLEARWGGVP